MAISFSRYIGVALGSTIVDWIVFVILTTLGIYNVTAVVLSRSAGGLFSFITNREWTFSAKQNRHVTVQGRRFLLLYGMSYGLAICLVYLFADIFNIPVYVSKLGADTGCFIFNFLVMKIYVFHERVGVSERLWAKLRRFG